MLQVNVMESNVFKVLQHTMKSSFLRTLVIEELTYLCLVEASLSCQVD